MCVKVIWFFWCYINCHGKRKCAAVMMTVLWDVIPGMVNSLWNMHLWLRKHGHSMSCTFTSHKLLFQAVIVFTDRTLRDAEIRHKPLTVGHQILLTLQAETKTAIYLYTICSFHATILVQFALHRPWHGDAARSAGLTPRHVRLRGITHQPRRSTADITEHISSPISDDYLHT